MAATPPPNPYYRNESYSPAPGVLSPEEWAGAVATQRIDRLLPEHQGWAWGGIEVRPKNVRFANQNKGEKVFILLRRHWITNISWVFSSVAYALLPVLAAFLLNLFKVDLLEVFEPRFIALTIGVYYSIVFTNMLRHFVDWYFNLYIVSNERVLSYQFRAFSSRRVSESDLDSIEDVKESSIGVIPSFFNYGDVSIFSAADKNVITFYSIPRPTYVRDKIDDLADIVKSTRGES